MPWFWKQSARPAAPGPRADRHGDPLPAGALARLGTGRLQHVVDQGNEGLGALAFSPDGTLLAGAGRDGRISLWEAATGRRLHMLARHGGEVNCLAFSPDGRLLVSGGRDGQAMLWDIAAGRLLYQVEGARVDVATVAFSPRGDAWAAAGYGGMVQLFDARRPEVLQELHSPADEDEERSEHFLAITFSPDGTRLAGASAYTFHAEEIPQDKVADFNLFSDIPFTDCGNVMDFIMSDPQGFADKMQEKAKDMMKAMQEEYGGVPPGHGFAFGEEGGVARGWRVGEAGRLTVWRLPTGTPEVCWDLEEGAPYLLAFSADGAALASVGRGVQAWDLAGKRRLPPDRFPARWHAVPGFSAQGWTILAPQGGPGPARVWDTVANREVLALEPERSWGPFAFSPEGDRLAVTLAPDTVEIRAAATGREFLPLPRHPAWIGGLALAAVAPVAAVLSGGVHLWDRATGAYLRRLAEAGRLPALSPDGTRLAGIVPTSSGETNVVVWDCQDGRRLTELEGLEPAALLFLDETTLLVGNALGQVGRYDLAAGRWAKVLRGADGTVEALAVSPCGQLVAGSGTDGVVRLWQLDSGKVVRELAVPAAEEAPGRRPPWLAFAADGTQLGWAAPAGLFLLWDAGTGKPTGRLTLAEPAEVCAISFDPHGRCLAAEAPAIGDEPSEYRLRLWDVRTGKTVFATRPQPEPITELAFTADGRQLASAGADRTVLFWDVSAL